MLAACVTRVGSRLTPFREPLDIFSSVTVRECAQCAARLIRRVFLRAGRVRKIAVGG